MDQTTSHSKKTYEIRGVKTVNIHLPHRTQDRPLLQYLCVQMIWRCLQCWFSKVQKMVGEFQNFQLAVSAIVRRMHGWMKAKCRSGLKNLTLFIETAPGNGIVIFVHWQKYDRDTYVRYHKKSKILNMKWKRGGVGAIGQRKAWFLYPMQPMQAKFTNPE